MIHQIVSKIKNNNYEKVNPYDLDMPKERTAFVDVKKLTIGVGNRNKHIAKMGISELLDNAKLE